MFHLPLRQRRLKFVSSQPWRLPCGHTCARMKPQVSLQPGVWEGAPAERAMLQARLLSFLLTPAWLASALCNGLLSTERDHACSVGCFDYLLYIYI